MVDPGSGAGEMLLGSSFWTPESSEGSAGVMAFLAAQEEALRSYRNSDEVPLGGDHFDSGSSYDRMICRALRGSLDLYTSDCESSGESESDSEEEVYSDESESWMSGDELF